MEVNHIFNPFHSLIVPNPKNGLIPPSPIPWIFFQQILKRNIPFDSQALLNCYVKSWSKTVKDIVFSFRKMINVASSEKQDLIRSFIQITLSKAGRGLSKVIFKLD